MNKKQCDQDVIDRDTIVVVPTDIKLGLNGSIFFEDMSMCANTDFILVQVASMVENVESNEELVRLFYFVSEVHENELHSHEI